MLEKSAAYWPFGRWRQGCPGHSRIEMLVARDSEHRAMRTAAASLKCRKPLIYMPFLKSVELFGTAKATHFFSMAHSGYPALDF